jgi:Inner membrane protein YgaP-like, transmembrane domain
MKQNESTADRIIRAVAGVILLVLGFGGVVTGTLAIVVDLIGVILLVTSAIGICPLYLPFHLSTKK